MKTKIVSLLLCVGMLFACNNTQKGAGIGAGGVGWYHWCHCW